MERPEKPTLAERLVELIPLPYPAAALVWTIITGPLGILVQYLAPGWSQAPSLTVEVIGSAAIFYLFYIVRYLRLKVVEAEPQITTIMHGREAEYHRVFGRLSNKTPVILLTIFLEALSIIVISSLGLSTLGPWDLATRIVILLTFACFMWEFCCTEWGLHRLGRSSVRLKSYVEDRFLGTRSIGNLALSSTIAYFGGVLILFLDFAVQFPVTSLWFESFFFTLLALGIVMFFLPLNSMHEQMEAELSKSRTELDHQYRKIRESGRPHSDPPPASLETIQNTIDELVQLKSFEVSEKKLEGAPTWPFDLELLAKLITIVLSVATVILTEIVRNYLRV